MFDAIIRFVDRCDIQSQRLRHLRGRTLLDHHLIKGLPGRLFHFGADLFEDRGGDGLGLVLDYAAQLDRRLGTGEAALPLQKGRAADGVLGPLLLPPPKVGQGVVDDGLQPAAELPLRRIVAVLRQLLEQFQQDVLGQIFGVFRRQPAALTPTEDHATVATVKHRPGLVAAAAFSQLAQQRDVGRWDRHGDFPLLTSEFAMDTE